MRSNKAPEKNLLEITEEKIKLLLNKINQDALKIFEQFDQSIKFHEEIKDILIAIENSLNTAEHLLKKSNLSCESIKRLLEIKDIITTQNNALFNKKYVQSQYKTPITTELDYTCQSIRELLKKQKKDIALFRSEDRDDQATVATYVLLHEIIAPKPDSIRFYAAYIDSFETKFSMSIAYYKKAIPDATESLVALNNQIREKEVQCCLRVQAFRLMLQQQVNDENFIKDVSLATSSATLMPAPQKKKIGLAPKDKENIKHKRHPHKDHKDTNHSVFRQ